MRRPRIQPFGFTMLFTCLNPVQQTSPLRRASRLLDQKKCTRCNAHAAQSCGSRIAEALAATPNVDCVYRQYSCESRCLRCKAQETCILYLISASMESRSETCETYRHPSLFHGQPYRVEGDSAGRQMVSYLGPVYLISRQRGLQVLQVTPYIGSNLR